MATIADYIVVDDHGDAMIAGTRMSVAMLVQEKNAWGCSPEELHRHHDDLSLAQIHAALAYYYDHQPAIDAAIDRDRQVFDRERAKFLQTPLGRKLAQANSRRSA